MTSDLNDADQVGRSRVADQIADIEPLVRGICRSRLGHDAGDDAAQTVLTRIWQRLDAGDQFNDLRTYAAVSAKYAGWQKPSRTVPVADSFEWRPDEDTPDPLEQLTRAEAVAEAHTRVEALLAQLSPRQEQVLRAGALADRSTAEIADELGIKPSSVRSAQTVAMAKMRERCGVDSPNPLASNVPMVERRRLAKQGQDQSVPAPRDSEPLIRDDAPTDGNDGVSPAARVVGEALPAGEDRAPSTAELIDRARRAVDTAVTTTEMSGEYGLDPDEDTRRAQLIAWHGDTAARGDGTTHDSDHVIEREHH